LDIIEMKSPVFVVVVEMGNPHGPWEWQPHGSWESGNHMARMCNCHHVDAIHS
jgi:hypothetical protein